MKKHIRLTESMLHGIVKDCVNRVLNEEYDISYAGFDDRLSEWDVSKASSFTEYFIPDEGLTNDETEPGILPVPVTIYPIVEFTDDDCEIVDFDWEFDTNDKTLSDELTNKYGRQIDDDIKLNFENMKKWTDIKYPF